MPQSSDQLVVHHLGASQSDRIVWLMEELELPYRLVWHDRGEDGLMQQNYRDLHPAATAPVIEDGEKVLTESVVVAEYICREHADGRLLVDPGSPHYYDYLFAMQLNNNLLGLFFAQAAARSAETQQAQFVGGFTGSRIGRYFGYMESYLANHAFLGGDEFSCADIMTMFPLTSLIGRMGVTLDGYPNLAAYVEKVAARPAYRKAMEIAGPQAKKPGV